MMIYNSSQSASFDLRFLQDSGEIAPVIPHAITLRYWKLDSAALTDRLVKMNQTSPYSRQLLTGGFKRHLSAAKYVIKHSTIIGSVQFTFIIHTHTHTQRGAVPYINSARFRLLPGQMRGSQRCVRARFKTVSEQKVKLSFPIFTPHTFTICSKIPLALPFQAHVPPSLATLWAWYDHSLDKHSSTMRSQKCFFFFFF